MNGPRGIAIAVAASFIVGCSVGLMGGILFMRYAAPGLHGGIPPRGMPGGRGPFFGRGGADGARHEEHMLSLLEEELDLSPEQRERVRARIDAAWRHHVAARDSLHVWLERELTPAQRERWRELEQRLGMPPRGRGPRPPPPQGP